MGRRPHIVSESSFYRLIGRVDTPALRILLVDDLQVNRQILRTHLRRFGYRIEEAADGAEALAKFQAQPFDLVFMDIEMSILDGYGATRAIRAWEVETGRRPVPIVALSAHSDAEVDERSRAAGCTAHLGKPIDGRALRETIAKWTSARPPVAVEADLRHLLPRFLEDMTEGCRSIEGALQRNDLEEVRFVSHRIVGAGGMFGFHEMSEMGSALEAAARTGDRGEITRIAERLAMHLDEMKIRFA